MIGKVNKKTMVIVILLLVICILCSCSNAQAADPGSGRFEHIDESLISVENVMKNIEELTSRKYKGRLPGTKENELAAEYIADYYKKTGLENSTELDNYLYSYNQDAVLLKEEPMMEIIDSKGNVVKKLGYTQNFVMRILSSGTDNIDIKSPVVVIEDIEDIKVINDEIRGKILLFSEEIMEEVPRFKLEVIANKNCVAASICETKDYNELTVFPLVNATREGEYSPMIFVDSESYDCIAENSKKDAELHFVCKYSNHPQKKLYNVVGLIPGTDNELKDEYIIIGAHFDHVGDNMNDTYNPGALDNASGVATMLEIARVLKENKIGPRKSILFIAFNSEESGMVGSSSYAESPIYPLDKAVMINLDGVGFVNKEIAIYDSSGEMGVLGNELYKDCKELEKRVLRVERINPIDFYSDHSSFYEQGVPSVMISCNAYNFGYHSPRDTIKNINEGSLMAYIKLVLYYIDKNAF